MPTRLRVELENENAARKGRSDRIVEILSRLCDQDESVEAAYLCYPAVQLITKIQKEGNLCGYRNIQMMISYIAGAKAQRFQQFADGVPSVLRLQDLIEDAWDKGINTEGRLETGGIRGTRKYIGTPEVCSKALRSYQRFTCGIGALLNSHYSFQPFLIIYLVILGC
jgi:hypothetical protein